MIEDVVTSEEFKEADEKKRLEIAKDTVEQLVDDKIVKEESVQVIEEEGVVTFQYEGGGSGTIHAADLPQPDKEEVSHPEESVIGDTIEKQEQKAEEAGATAVGPQEEIPIVEDTKAEWSKQPEPSIDVVITPKPATMTIRVYNAFEDSEYRNRNYESLVSNWKDEGFSEEQIILDNEVYVEELLEIPNYTLVSFSMHGSVCCDGNGNVLPVILLMDDKSSAARNKELESYLANYEIAKVYTQHGGAYAVFPKLFSNHFSKDDLANTIIYSESCMFFGECSLNKKCNKKSGIYCDSGSVAFADALCDSGCPAVLGFHNSVYADYAIGGLYVFGIAINMGYTPEYAFCAFTDIMGETDRTNVQTGNTAYPLLFGKNITCTVSDLLQQKEVVQQTSQQQSSEETSEKEDDATSSSEWRINKGIMADITIYESPDDLGFTIGDIFTLNYVPFEEGYEFLSTDIRDHEIQQCVGEIDGVYWLKYFNDNFDADEYLVNHDITEEWIRVNGDTFNVYTRLDEEVNETYDVFYKDEKKVERVEISRMSMGRFSLICIDIYSSDSTVGTGEKVYIEWEY